MRLKGKVALVTGAAVRLGRTIALTLAREGAGVVVNYNTSQKQADQVVKEITRLKSKAIAIKADISRAEDVHRLVDRAVREFQRIDLLINNAGIFVRAPLKELTEEIWDRTLNTNLKGPFLVSQKVAEVMLPQKSGKIINVSSLGGIRAWPSYMHYCASKAGVIMLTKCLALALAPYIQVNSIAPGTGFFPEDFTDKQREKIIAKIPLKKLGSAQEIADLVVFLATNSEFITGQTFVVDGGRSIAL